MPVTAVRTAIPAGHARPAGLKVCARSAHWYAFNRRGVATLWPTDLTRRWHPGPAPVALTAQDLAGESSTSAVTVKVAKRSASGPDTAGASGSGLAPPPGAARFLLRARLGA